MGTRRQNAHDVDPTLWFLVRDGDEIAARPQRAGAKRRRVRRRDRRAAAWRGKGIGRALLLRTFAEFYSRGVHRVTLGVDAESPTGATRLYESVGMNVEDAIVVYEKALG